MIEFTHTDFPAPVEPAIKRWGVVARSRSWASPVISFPRMTGISIFFAWGVSVSISSRKLTRERLRFGTSMPTACFPGIGATIRTLEAARRVVTPRGREFDGSARITSYNVCYTKLLRVAHDQRFARPPWARSAKSGTSPRPAKA